MVLIGYYLCADGDRLCVSGRHLRMGIPARYSVGGCPIRWRQTYCVQALKAAIQDYGCPQIVNTDQGAQYTSEIFTDMLKDNHIQISMDGKGCYRDNIFVERLWRTVKYEPLYTRAFGNLKEVKLSLVQWFDWYNQGRFHQGLDDLTPDAVYYQYLTISQAA